MNPNSTSRREFVIATTAATLLAALNPLTVSAQPTAKTGIKLGFDNFSVRAMGWKAAQLIDYAAELKTDSLFISDMDALESFEPSYLEGVRKSAADKGLQIHLGTWSICPTSKSFRNKWGTAEEHLRVGLKNAKALGSPVLRVILGNGDDRKTEGGIEARIADMVKVCKAVRSEAMDLGVKIAVENHAGDLHSTELVNLIEAAGKDFVGANIDSGNAVWTLEDPLQNLETLGKYVLTTSLRDSLVWQSENGATVQWTAMGEGNVDFKTYFKRFAELCPGVPVHIETISGFNRELTYLKQDFWSAWPNAKASDFALFLALARKGKPAQGWNAPAGTDRKLAEQAYQKGDVERSIKYCKETLGLGLKPV